MIFTFKPENGTYSKETFKTILDRLEIENTVLDDKLTFSVSIDQLIKLDQTIDPEDVGWYDPDELWG